MAVVIGGIALTAGELATLAAGAATALFLATPTGQQATRDAAQSAADAIGRLRRPTTASSDQTDAPPLAPPLVQDCPKQKRCPPCVPPVGTIAYEVHRVPPQDPHYPCPEDHVHFFRKNQNPNNCQCFWKRNALPVHCLPHGTPYVPRPGEVPL